MSDIFCVDTIRSIDSEHAAEEIQGGEPAVRLAGDGGVRPLDVTSDAEVHYAVAHFREADWNLRYETDYVSYPNLYTYKPESAKTGDQADEDWDDRVPLQPLVDKDVFRFQTIEDDTEPAPSIDENDTVGFVDLGNGPRLVEAGYTDSGSTQYGDGGTGDFVAVGRADELEAHASIASDHGELVPVRVER